jgi:hypothetical protein
VIGDPQGLARSGDLVKPAEEQMTTAPNGDSASDELGYAVARVERPLSRKVPRLDYAVKLKLKTFLTVAG